MGFIWDYCRGMCRCSWVLPGFDGDVKSSRESLEIRT